MASENWVDSGANVYIDGGKVGIGSSSTPGAALDIFSGDLYIRDGKVGIGTPSPDASLDVEIGTNAEALRLTRTAEDPAVLRFGFDQALGSGYAYVQGDRFDPNPQPVLLNPYGGQVAIGMAPTFETGYALLQVAGGAQLKGPAATSGAPLRNSGQMRLTGAYWNGTVSVPLDATLQTVVSAVTPSLVVRLSIAVGASGEMVSLKNNGNVGIAVTDPAAKLDVGGDLRASTSVSTPTVATLSGDLTLSPAGSHVVVATGKVLKAAAGSQSAPAVTLGGDTGTGLYWPAANKLAIAVNGQQQPRLFVNSDGAIGIGNSNPSFALDVSGDIRMRDGYISLPSTGRLYFSDMYGSRYVKDNPDTGKEWIEFVARVAMGDGGFHPEYASPNPLGITIDENGTIQTNGNFQVLRTDPSLTPVVWHLGRQGFQNTAGSLVPKHTNYFFWQDRANRYGWWWTGWNSFRHPATVKTGPNTAETVARGYGYYPLRSMGKNVLFEASGEIVSSFRFVGPAVYFQDPLHIDLAFAQPSPPVPEPPSVAPDGYTSDLRPYINLGVSTSLNGSVAAGATQITVASTTGFSSDDEIYIGSSDNSEINEIASISGSVLYLKRDTKSYGGSETVKTVRELGGVQPDRSSSGLGIHILRDGNDLVFTDAVGSITLDQIRQGLGI